MGQVLSQPLQQFRPVLRPLFPALLVLHDPPADLPVRRGHDGIDRTSRGATGGLEEAAEVVDEAVVAALGQWGTLDPEEGRWDRAAEKVPRSRLLRDGH